MRLRDENNTSVKHGDIILEKETGRVLLVQQRIPNHGKFDDLDVVELQLNSGASRMRARAEQTKIIGHVNMEKLP